MTDKIEQQLAEGMEEDLGIKAMAAKLAPREGVVTDAMRGVLPRTTSYVQSSGTVESKLVEIERLIRDIRSISAQIKGQLG